MPGLALVAALLLGADPAGGADGALRFPCSARGGPEWRELTSENVRLWTDLPSDEAREMVRELELARAAVLHALFARPPAIPAVLQAVAFARRSEYEAVSPRNAVAWYTTLDGLTPTVVLPGTIAFRARATIVHELTHHLTSFPLLRKPMWLNEGFAVYMESIGATDVRRKMTVGTVPEGRRILRNVDEGRSGPFAGSATGPGRIPAAKVLAWKRIDPSWSNDTAVRYYESSWLLVHYLVNRHPDALADLFRRLGRAEDPALAWKASFPKWDPATPGALEALEDELDDYARHGKVQYRTLDLQVSPKIVERPLPSPDVHSLRARLLPHGGEKRLEALRAEIDEALAEDPGAPLPILTLAMIDPKADRLPLARAAVRTHPDDWRAWTALAGALSGTERGERLEALRKALALAPGQPIALRDLAEELASSGMEKEAAPYALELVRLRPDSSEAHALLARVAMGLGRCADALRAQQRAVDTLSDRAPAAERRRQEELLAGYQGSCAASGTP